MIFSVICLKERHLLCRRKLFIVWLFAFFPKKSLIYYLKGGFLKQTFLDEGYPRYDVIIKFSVLFGGTVWFDLHYLLNVAPLRSYCVRGFIQNDFRLGRSTGAN